MSELGTAGAIIVIGIIALASWYCDHFKPQRRAADLMAAQCGLSREPWETNDSLVDRCAYAQWEKGELARRAALALQKL